MALNLLTPYKGDHAIQNVTFALEWAGELSGEVFLELRKRPELTGDGKFRVTEQRGIMVNLNEIPGGASTNPTFDIAGVQFDKISSFGSLSKALIINKHHCMFVNNEYTRWDRVWPETRELFAVVLPEIVRFRPITAIGLQYTDIFIWRGNPADFDLSLLFNRNSAFLSENIFKLKSQWHLYQGYFDSLQIENDIRYNTLNNINISTLNMDGVLGIQIVTAHRAILEEAKANVSSWANQDGELDGVMHKLHGSNKEILKSLLTPEVQAMIKLN